MPQILPSRSRQPGQSSPPQTEEPHKESHCPQSPHSQRCASRSSAGQTSTPEGRVVPCEASTELAPKSCFVEHSSELPSGGEEPSTGWDWLQPTPLPFEVQENIYHLPSEKKKKDQAVVTEHVQTFASADAKFLCTSRLTEGLLHSPLKCSPSNWFQWVQ